LIKVTKSQALKTLPDFNQLGFGQYFSDHMFVANYAHGKGWQSAEIVPYGDYAIDPAASVLHYGQALFEGMKAFKQVSGDVVLFRPSFNSQRMRLGAERLCMQAPDDQFFLNAISELLKIDQRWIPEGFGKSLYIRPTLIGTEPFLGVRPSHHFKFFVILSPVGAYYSGSDRGIKIFVEERDLRAAPGGLGATKAAANYAASLRAALAAKDLGYAQVLWLDVERKHVEEVGTMNVFFKVADELWTPQLNGSILPGATRDSLITLARARKINVIEKKISMAELTQAYSDGRLTEVFGAGTAAVVTPVTELKYKDQQWNFTYTKNSLSELLYSELTQIQYGQAPDPFGWIHKLTL
jgi:branched-chain amino acid aminotransferase